MGVIEAGLRRQGSWVWYRLVLEGRNHGCDKG